MSTSAHAVDRPASANRTLNVALWIVQILLFAMFAFAGFMKLTAPFPQLAAMMPWTIAVPHALVRFIGLSEFAGALGLIVPAVTRIMPKLTGYAGAGLFVIMLNAIGFHLFRAEYNVAIQVVLAALSAFVAWGRLRKVPIAPR